MTGGASASGSTHVLSAMKKMAKALQYIPGNKYVIFMSEGYSSSFASSWWFRENFKEIAQVLATSSVPVYSVNPDPGHDNLGRRPGGDIALAYLSQVSGGRHFATSENTKTSHIRSKHLPGIIMFWGIIFPKPGTGNFIRSKFKSIERAVRFSPRPVTTVLCRLSGFPKRKSCFSLWISLLGKGAILIR